MMRRLLLVLAVVLLAPPALAQAPNRADIAAEVERLAQHYAAKQRELDAHEAQARALAEPGSSLAAYRDLAMQVLAARDDLAATQARLEELYRRLDEMGPQMGPFRIVATQDDFDGPPIDMAISNDRLIALKATVPNPTDPALLPTYLIWKIIRGTGEDITGYMTTETVETAGGETETDVRFQLDKLEKGLYVATLLHQSQADPSIKREESFAFNIVQALAIERVWVTATAGDETGRDRLAGDELAHVYVAYRGAGEVHVALRVRHAQSGTLAFAREWTRDPEPGRRRTGFRLPEGVFEPGDRLVAEFTLTAADGTAKTASSAFAIEGRAAALSLDVPARIADDQLARFSIGVPDGFAPPYSVDVDAPGLTVALAAPGALQGTVHGRAPTGDSAHQMRVTVTDAKGRRASGRAVVTVVAPRAAPPPAAAATHPPPPSAGRQEAATSAPGSAPARKTAPPQKAGPALHPPKAASGGPSQARPAAPKPSGRAAQSGAAPSGAPSAARAAECRRLHVAYQQALDHRRDLVERIRAINDGLSARFLAAWETHKARLKAAGGSRRAGPELQAETEKYEKYFALSKTLAATKDCGQIVYGLKDSWAARTFGYPAEEATRLCLSHSDAHRAASQARAAAKGCLTSDGKLRPEFAEGYVAKKKTEKPEAGGSPRCVEVDGVAVEAARIVDGKPVLGGITTPHRGSLAPRCREDGAGGAGREFPHAAKICGVTVWFDDAEAPAAVRRFAASLPRGFTHVAVAVMSDIHAHCLPETLR